MSAEARLDGDALEEIASPEIASRLDCDALRAAIATAAQAGVAHEALHRARTKLNQAQLQQERRKAMQRLERVVAVRDPLEVDDIAELERAIQAAEAAGASGSSVRAASELLGQARRALEQQRLASKTLEAAMSGELTVSDSKR